MSGHPDDLLEAYAFGDCADPSVAAHVGSCGACSALVSTAARTAAWLSASHFEAPPIALRSRMLTAARSARAPSISSALDAYAAQVASFGVLLDGLSARDWQAPVTGGRTVAELVSHLAANDARVADDLGLSAPPSVRLSPSARLSPPPGGLLPVAGLSSSPVAGLSSSPVARLEWRDRSDRLLRTVGSRADLLGHPVRLAGRIPVRRPLRDALTQRAFETWIHDSDVREAIALPPVSPPPLHLARIVALGLALLPGAMDSAGRGRPGTTVFVRLTGPGGDSFVVPMSAGPASGGSPVAEIRLPAERFGRLLAGRIPVPASAAEISGDRSAALDLLAVAATLGCE
ncbi:maleylpyruvate isomerase family mycothiol-dependent enzyme [Paractinoplanes toevensis]|uniref:Mycothiol-dependent maleylpyruvate isomerase metal-binding domain-containing protein n=1 Tax=Paractinoplanes toevensis TaxID=571911 RepID=A0A919W4P4_9ACTN|nr:maleylpyruvate isomerase family mycothiol-dependent enzyme [Actinoplanes toevensis]GIM94339.1 hypothetical protein Ato02nite_061320 [Actinoplanes toevensis]